MASRENVPPTALSAPTTLLRSTATSARARATASDGTSTGPSSYIGTSSVMRASTSVASVNRESNITPQRQRQQRPGESRSCMVAPPTPLEQVVSPSNADQEAIQRSSRTLHLMVTERKCFRACEHVSLLNGRIRGLKKRYQSGVKSLRYIIQMRLYVFEGVRCMYYEYARDRVEEIVKLHKELYDRNVRIEFDDEIDSDDDEEEDMEADDE